MVDQMKQKCPENPDQPFLGGANTERLRLLTYWTNGRPEILVLLAREINYLRHAETLPERLTFLKLEK